MKLHSKIREKILTDNKLSLQIALALDKTQEAVKLRAKRNSENLASEKAVEIYRSYGFTKIYENE